MKLREFNFNSLKSPFRLTNLSVRMETSPGEFGPWYEGCGIVAPRKGEYHEQGNTKGCEFFHVDVPPFNSMTKVSKNHLVSLISASANSGGSILSVSPMPL